MTRPGQSYMAQGWTNTELAEANTEASLSNPPWERNAYDGYFPAHDQRCVPCGVAWRSSDDLSVCWMCGEPPVHQPNSYWPSTLQAPSVRREWEYSGQPKTPASGCGCDDPTVPMVAKLHADGWDLWSACLLVYGEVA